MRGKVRRYLRKLWESRGGGFYGFAAALSFLYLEAIDLAGEVARVPRWDLFDIGWWIGWGVGNLVDFVLNTVWAAMWPVVWLQTFGIGLLSAGLLAATYAGYRAIRPTVLRLLQDPDDDVLLQPATGKVRVTGG